MIDTLPFYTSSDFNRKNYARQKDNSIWEPNSCGEFYISIVHYNGYHWPELGKSEWEVNEEIGQVYCFPELIQDGMDFVQTNSYMFNQYKKSEVLEKMIEKWQYS